MTFLQPGKVQSADNIAPAPTCVRACCIFPVHLANSVEKMNSARQESPLPTGKMQSQTSPPPPEEVQQQAKSNNGGNGGSTSSCKTVWVNAEFSVYVGNLDPDTSVEDMEELLYELFLQVGNKDCLTMRAMLNVTFLTI